MTVSRTPAIRLAKTGRPRMPELPFGFDLIGSVPQAHSPSPYSIFGTERGVGSLYEAHLSAPLENSIVAMRQLGCSRTEFAAPPKRHSMEMVVPHQRRSRSGFKIRAAFCPLR